MSNSILSWDALAEENPIIAKAQESLKNLDPTPGLDELAEQERAIQARKEKAAMINEPAPALQGETPLELSVKGIAAHGKNILERAMANLAKARQDELSGGRVQVDDKKLLNCRADLNQLVPFKYNWAWSLYLISCDSHWMPAEIPMIADQAIYPALSDANKLVIGRLVTNYMYSKQIYPTEMFVGLYKNLTNPECRQFILRQMFEEGTIDTSIRNIIKNFDLNNNTIGGKSFKEACKVDELILRRRMVLAKVDIDLLADPEFTTDSVAKTQDFIRALIILYGYVKWTYFMVPYYQVLALGRQGKLSGVAKNVTFMLADMVRQNDFAILLLNGIIAENPECITDEFVIDVQRMFNILIKEDISFADVREVSTEDNTTGDDLENVVKFTSDMFMSAIGLKETETRPNANTLWFAEMIKGMHPHVDHSASIQSSAGGSTGPLVW